MKNKWLRYSICRFHIWMRIRDVIAMVIRRIKGKLYRELIGGAAWFSPVQDMSSQNTFLLTHGTESLIFGYTIYGNVAIISLAFLSGGTYSAFLLRTALDNLLITNHSLTELVIYLIDELDVHHLKNEVYSFVKLGVFTQGLRDACGFYHDLYLFGCAVEASIPPILSGADFNQTSFPRLLMTKLPTLYGDRPAISYTERDEKHDITYRMLPQVVSNLVDQLSLPHAEKRYIALVGENSPFWLLSCLAVLCSGCILVLVDNNHIDTELLGKCATVLSDDHLYSQLNSSLESAQRNEKYEDICRYVIAKPANSIVTVPSVEVDDDALIASTSGTSGAGKHVVLTHGNIISSLAHVMLTTDKYVAPGCEVIFPCMPPCHAYSTVCGFLAPLLYGAEINFGSVNELNLIHRFQEVNPSVLITVPSVMKTLAHCVRDGIGEHEPSRLGFAVVGGSDIDSEIIRLEERLGIPLLCGYGLTECTSFVYCNTVENGKVYLDTDSLNSCFCHLKVVDGHIEVFGRVVAKGYLDGKQFYGHIRTEDAAHFGEGRLYLDGRTDGAIVLANGNKVVPEIIEQNLCCYPSIKEARVYGFKKGNMTLLGVQIVAKDSSCRGAVVADIEKFNETASPYERIVRIECGDEGLLERTALGKIRHVDLSEE